MNNIPTYAKVIDGLLAILAGVVLWFARRSVKQYDDRIEILERDSVRVDSLRQFRSQLSIEHGENRKKLARIESRVDDIFKELIRK